MSFGLRRFAVQDITRDLELPEISVDVERPLTLRLRPLSDANGDFLSYQAKQRKARTVKDDGTAEALRAQRARVGRVIAETCLVGWSEVYDDATPNVPAPWSKEAGIRLMDEITSDDGHSMVWNKILSFVISAENFVGAVNDPAELGKP